MIFNPEFVTPSDHSINSCIYIPSSQLTLKLVVPTLPLSTFRSHGGAWALCHVAPPHLECVGVNVRVHLSSDAKVIQRSTGIPPSPECLGAFITGPSVWLVLVVGFTVHESDPSLWPVCCGLSVLNVQLETGKDVAAVWLVHCHP